MRTVHLLAPAKLTVSLAVGPRRLDGRHDIDSEMVTVDLYDELAVDESGDGLVSLGREIPGGPTLISRALDLVGRRAGVTLTKNIPVGGGLGGGSADAAAILRWAGGVSAERALELGSDVPFCQVGGRARVRGVGESIEPLSYREERYTLILLPLHLSTGLVFNAFDELVRGGSRPVGRNQLTEAALRVEPALRGYVEALSRASGTEIFLAGSGSTLYCEGWVDLTDARGPGSFEFRHVTTTPEAS